MCPPTMQARALFLSLMVVTLSLSGCFGEAEVVEAPEGTWIDVPICEATLIRE